MSLGVAEYCNVNKGFKLLIASFCLGVLAVDWGSSMITIGLVLVINCIGITPFSVFHEFP